MIDFLTKSSLFLMFITPFLMILIHSKFLSKVPAWVVFTLSVLLFWGLVQFNVFIIEWHINQQLEQLDLNHNTFFDKNEITPEVEKLLNQLTHDTGRALAPITGMIASLVYNGLISKIYAYLKSKEFKNDKTYCNFRR